MRNWGNKNELTLSQQFFSLKMSPVCAGDGKISHRKLTWRFRVQPTPLSREYRVRLEYKLGGTPDVFVEHPDLQMLAAKREIPHVYRNPLRLCLYLPWSDQWTPNKRINQTIVPWTYTWLYFFEDWLAFGQWRGGGQHRDDRPERPMNRKLRRFLSRNSRRAN